MEQICLRDIRITSGKQDISGAMEEIAPGAVPVLAKFEMTTSTQTYYEHVHRFSPMDQVKEHMLVIIASGGG